MSSRKMSIAETMVNQAMSFMASYIVSLCVYGSVPSLGCLTTILFVVGFIRGYMIRRFFAHHRVNTKLFAVIETIVSIAAGFFSSLGISAVVCSILDIPVSASSQTLVSFILIFVSFVRGYIVRRVFSRIS